MGNINYLPTKRVVELLLEKGKEGEYWDFKQEWHENIADLLKDIICFANTSHDQNCYLIFGVNDYCKITGMKKKRRKQADILEALSNLWFAGDIMPDISVELIIINDMEIDVLTIYDIVQTPLYLKRNYGDMLAGCIYMRKGDKNTPNRGNADIWEIETLWQKRFGLLKPPLEYIYDRLQYLLQWKQQGDIFYNLYKPEYQLELQDNDDDHLIPEFYAYAMTNESTSYQILQIKCGNTVLDEHQIVILDSGRYKTPTPEWGYLCHGQCRHDHKYEYKYYVVGSDRYKLYKFFLDNEDDEGRIANKHLMEVVLMYESEDEHNLFEEFIEVNQNILENKLNKKDRFAYIHAINERNTEVCKVRLNIGLCLNEMLVEFRKN